VSWDKTIKLWDLSSGKVIASIGGHSSPLNVVTFSPDGKLACPHFMYQAL
jgi:WD40 repeat protein